MKFGNLKKIEDRILEIKQVLSDEARKKKMASGVSMHHYVGRLAKADAPLSAELDELQIKRGFIHDKRVLLINVVTIISTLVIAFTVPPWHERWKQEQAEREDIRSLYYSIIANQDIYINNFNEFRSAENNKISLPLPEALIEFPVDDNLHQMLQSSFGIDLYRFFLYYLGQTDFLNDERERIRSRMLEKGILTSVDLADAKSYKVTLESLDSGTWENAKFNYIYDTTCLLYVFQKSFSFIEVRERESTANCSTDSLNRLFYQYGVIQSEIPSWIIPELRAALKERDPELANLIQDK